MKGESNDGKVSIVLGLLMAIPLQSNDIVTQMEVFSLLVIYHT